MATEVLIITPMFLNSARQAAFDHATWILAQQNDPEEGDSIEAECVGITKDTDGWPLQRWRVYFVKHE